jgi:subtilisin family serine protease
MRYNYSRTVTSSFSFKALVAFLVLLGPPCINSTAAALTLTDGTNPQRTKPKRPRPQRPDKKAKPELPSLNLRTNEFRPNEVLVRFREPISSNLIRGYLKKLGNVDRAVKVGSVPNLYLIHSRDKTTEELLKILLLDRDVVVYAEPNFVVRLDSLPNDTSFSRQWGLKNTGSNLSNITGVAGQDTSAELAWGLFSGNEIGSRSIVVAVIDTGVDYTHPDLEGNIWRAPREYSVTVGGQSIQCQAGTHGFDFINNHCDPLDSHGHGTRVAGVIGAQGNNSLGITGVNWATRIMPIKAIDPDGNSNVATAIQAIDFAIQVKNYFKTRGGEADVRILNNSYGWYATNCSCQSLLNQIDIANAEGMLVVASAGNDGINTDNSASHYPSGYGASNVISVAAFGCAGEFAGFSNFGQTGVHLAAPGKDIYSTKKGGTYGFSEGTSLAAPFVSGAAALMLARCPTLSNTSLKTKILSNVDAVPSWSTRPTSTNGRLNIFKALNDCDQ